MLDRKAGDKLDMTVRRNGKPLTLSLALGEVPEAPQAGRRTRPGKLLGLELQAIPAADFRQKYPHPLSRRPAGDRRSPQQPRRRAGHPLRRRAGGHAHLGDRLAGQRGLYSQAARLHQLTPVKFFILRGNDTLYGFMAVSTKTTRQE